MKQPHHLITEYLSDVVRGKALDVGAGNGTNSYYLANELGYTVDSVDNKSRGLVTDGENIFSSVVESVQRLPIKLHSTDINKFLVGKTNYYDLVIAINSLQFMDDIGQVASSLVRSIKNDGMLICSVVTRTVEGDKNVDVAAVKPLVTVKQMRKMFGDLEVMHLEENLVYDEPHYGMNKPHVHSIIEFVGEKKE